MQQAILLARQGIEIAMPQEADVPFRFEIIEILREGAKLSIKKLDRARILHSAIDRHLLA